MPSLNEFLTMHDTTSILSNLAHAGICKISTNVYETYQRVGGLNAASNQAALNVYKTACERFRRILCKLLSMKLEVATRLTDTIVNEQTPKFKLRAEQRSQAAAGSGGSMQEAQLPKGGRSKTPPQSKPSKPPSQLLPAPVKSRTKPAYAHPPAHAPAPAPAPAHAHAHAHALTLTLTLTLTRSRSHAHAHTLTLTLAFHAHARPHAHAHARPHRHPHPAPVPRASPPSRGCRVLSTRLTRTKRRSACVSRARRRPPLSSGKATLCA